MLKNEVAWGKSELEVESELDEEVFLRTRIQMILSSPRRLKFGKALKFDRSVDDELSRHQILRIERNSMN